MATSIETMKSFMNVLKQYANDTTTSGIAIMDQAVRAVSRFGSLQEAIGSFVNDVTDTSRYADTAQRLKETCGIVLGKENDFTADTGAVSGANAGNGTVKDAVSIVPETGTLTELSMPTAGSVTSHTYTASDGQTFSFNIQWPESFTQVVDRKWQTYDNYNPNAWTNVELTDQTFASDAKNNSNTRYYTAQDLRNSIATIAKGMEHWWVSESAKLAYDSYGLDFNGKTLKVEFFVNQEKVQADTGPIDKKENDTTPANVIGMSIGLPIYGIIDPVDVNGNTRVAGGFEQCYLDRTIAHEMIHAVMDGTGTLKKYENTNVASMPEFFTEGVAELVMGLDDYDAGNTSEITSLATNKTALEQAMTLASGTGTDIRYTSGYMFLRYLCQQGLAGQSGGGDTPAGSLVDAFGYIDSQGSDYAEGVVLDVLSGSSAARYASSADKTMNYNASAALGADAEVFHQEDGLSKLAGGSPQDVLLAGGQNA